MSKAQTRMTFKQFTAARRESSDVMKDCELFYDTGYDQPVGGLLYCEGRLVIEYTFTWPDGSLERRQRSWYLIIGNADFQSDSITVLEKRLYKYAVEEGMA